jgi:hypothetical protein
MTIDQLLMKVADEYCFGSSDLWQEKVKSFPKNEWVTPNNKDGEDFTMYNEMSYHGWADKLIEPLWKNGSFIGNRISFRIKIDQ